MPYTFIYTYFPSPLAAPTDRLMREQLGRHFLFQVWDYITCPFFRKWTRFSSAASSCWHNKKVQSKEMDLHLSIWMSSYKGTTHWKARHHSQNYTSKKHRSETLNSFLIVSSSSSSYFFSYLLLISHLCQASWRSLYFYRCRSADPALPFFQFQSGLTQGKNIIIIIISVGSGMNGRNTSNQNWSVHFHG